MELGEIFHYLRVIKAIAEQIQTEDPMLRQFLDGVCTAPHVADAVKNATDDSAAAVSSAVDAVTSSLPSASPAPAPDPALAPAPAPEPPPAPAPAPDASSAAPTPDAAPAPDQSAAPASDVEVGLGDSHVENQGTPS